MLVTHNHYDHLDIATLSQLARLRPSRILTPLGNDTIMRAANPALQAEAYDWGARVVISKEVSVGFEPAYHWSARGLSDRRMALWASFAIKTPAGTIYHIGDTAYGDGALFKQARRDHPDIRLAIIPIGAYAPVWFMADQHICPEQSVSIFRDLGAAQALAHHWGTFRLTDEPIEEPPQRLAAALAREGVAAEKFVVKRPGEFLFVS